MLHIRKLGLATAFIATFLLGGFMIPRADEAAGPRLFQEVFTLISRRYVDSLDAGTVYEKAARGLVAELQDPYADLFSPEELERFTVTHEGHYGGIGMLVEAQNGVTVVSRVFPNTPAEKAGVQVGDRIAAVGEESTEGWSVSRVADNLKGEPGTDVKVSFRRPGFRDAIVAQLTRAVIRIPAVPYAATLEGDVGYIPLLQFNETAADEAAEAVQELMNQGARRLILDLRGNGGGLVDAAVDIAGLFLPHGTEVVHQRERIANDDVYVARNGPLTLDVPLVVLIDEASASASEIVAGALQDHDRALVVGQPSFGKGLVQSVYRLDGGYLLKMTTGKWYTPAGRSIHRERDPNNGRALDAPSLTEERPVYHSTSGRVIYGGGGIMPDYEVRQDTLSAAEQALVETIVPHSQTVYLTIFDYAFELKDSVSRDFQVPAEWRAELYRRLSENGVEIERAEYAAASHYVDRLLRDRVARLAFGDEVAKLKALEDDTQLMAALDLLAQGKSLEELFARVARSHEPGG